MPIKIDFTFREEVARIIDGNLVGFCYQCGACVGDCPSTRYNPDFNPRQIMLEVLYGLSAELICEDSIVWKCTNCYTCYERCPQRVKPVEVIIALKNLMAERGIFPQGMEEIIESVRQTGRSLKVTSLSDRIRQELGLEPIKPVDVSDFKVLFGEDKDKAEAEKGEEG